MEIENLLLKVTQSLEELKIPYLVTGGIAVAIWGRPRSTLDIDIVIKIKREQISPLVRVFKKIWLSKGLVYLSGRPYFKKTAVV